MFAIIQLEKKELIFAILDKYFYKLDKVININWSFGRIGEIKLKKDYFNLEPLNNFIDVSIVLEDYHVWSLNAYSVTNDYEKAKEYLNKSFFKKFANIDSDTFYIQIEQESKEQQE